MFLNGRLVAIVAVCTCVTLAGFWPVSRRHGASFAMRKPKRWLLNNNGEWLGDYSQVLADHKNPICHDVLDSRVGMAFVQRKTVPEIRKILRKYMRGSTRSTIRAPMSGLRFVKMDFTTGVHRVVAREGASSHSISLRIKGMGREQWIKVDVAVTPKQNHQWSTMTSLLSGRIVTQFCMMRFDGNRITVIDSSTTESFDDTLHMFSPAGE